LHDQYGNPAKVVETGNASRTTDLTYFNDATKWIIGKPDQETIDSTWVTDRTFDDNGNITSVNKYGVVTSYTYHPDGEVATVTDARGKQTIYSNYYRGVPQREDQPEAVVITRTVNPTGTVASETNGESATTSYTYDGLNRITSVDPPVGNSTTIQWPDVSSNSKLVTRGNFQEISAFDGFGRVVENIKRDSIGSPMVRKVFQYDALGRKTAESYPTSSPDSLAYLLKITYSYDIQDRITQIKHADNKTRTLQYLPANQVKLTNENGQVYTYTYRSFGNPDERHLMSVSAPVAAANLTLTRNSLGQITGMVQNGITRTMQYDTKGFLNKVNHPEIGWVTYTRDAVGNPLTKSVGTAPSTRTISYVHDGRNRLTATTYQDATTPPVALAYNKVDDVTAATRGGVTRTYGYDLNRNLSEEMLSIDGRLFSLNYQYDGNDALSQVTYPDGQTVNYYPDALGRPTAVSPYVTSVAYHPSGQVAAMYYTNGVTTTQSFNARMWPSQMSVVKPGANLINTAYGYDGLGNVLSMTDSVDASYNRTLTYDAIDRLTGANGPWGTGTITYDGRGNLLTQVYGTSVNRAYTYDTANRLASYTGSSAFTYDAWGNATRSGTALSYHLFDDASNLYCASCDTASPMSFEYDAANYRVKKTRNGITTYSLYAKDGNLMMEYTPSGGDLKQFAYHNKKQVAMRHVVDPAMNLGLNSLLADRRLAAAIPRKPAAIEDSFMLGLISIPPLLTLADLAISN
jgi:YD repeat-containing protein